MSGIKFKSLICFELRFAYALKWVQFHSFLCGSPAFPTPFIEETVFPHCIFLAPWS